MLVLIGGLATVAGGWLATIWTHKRNLDLHMFQQQKQIHGILRAIRNELEVLGDIYRMKAGAGLAATKDGEPYQVYFSLTEKYFIVYPNNTEIVGQIDDPELCKAIVVTYNKANFLLEAFRINNRYLDKLSELNKIQAVQQMAVTPYVQNNLVATRERLAAHAGQLKLGDADFKRETESLLAKIDNYLSNHTVKDSA